MQGVHQQRVTGAWTTVPGGATSIFLAVQCAGKRSVWGVPKMQVLQQKRLSLGRAWHPPKLRAPPGDSGHRGTPNPASGTTASHSTEAKGCAQEHTDSSVGGGKGSLAGVLPSSPKGVRPQGAPTGWA